jgi:hypothetical protein
MILRERIDYNQRIHRPRLWQCLAMSFAHSNIDAITTLYHNFPKSVSVTAFLFVPVLYNHRFDIVIKLTESRYIQSIPWMGNKILK